MNQLCRRLRFLLRRSTFESELDEEMRFHLEMSARKSRDGQARRKFGNVGNLKEASREMWGWTSLERLWQDLAYAVRQLRRSPGFSIVAVLSLALGIGANTAIFGLIDHVMLRFLPVRNPDELLVVRGIYSYPQYEELRDRNQVFSPVFGAHPLSYAEVRIDGNAASQETAELVSGSYFKTLGVRAARGRTILPEDDLTPESSPVAVISNGYWKRVFEHRRMFSDERSRCGRDPRTRILRDSTCSAGQEIALPTAPCSRSSA